MAKEIERKFRVRAIPRDAVCDSVEIVQGYLLAEPERSVRVRLAGEKAKLTVKGAQRDATRDEFEYTIPVADAREMLEGLCLRPLVEKTRHRARVGAHLWEIDEFHGENRGLCVAEVELERRDEEVELPEWVGEEVTDDPRYLNANLVRNPYRRWE